MALHGTRSSTVTALIIENAPNLRTVIFGEIPNLLQREPSWLRNPNLPVVIQYNGEDWECSLSHAVRTNKLAELIGENCEIPFSIISAVTVLQVYMMIQNYRMYITSRLVPVRDMYDSAFPSICHWGITGKSGNENRNGYFLKIRSLL